MAALVIRLGGAAWPMVIFFGLAASGTSRLSSISSIPSARLAPRHLDMVGQLEAALEFAARNAAINELALIALVLLASRNDQHVFMGRDVNVRHCIACDSEPDAVGILPILFDIIGWIGPDIERRGVFKQVEKVVKADQRPAVR